MKLLLGLGSLGLLSALVVGCSSDASTDGAGGGSSAGASGSAGAAAAGASGSGQAGASSVDPKDCAAVGAQQKKLITALSCKDTSGEIKESCELLYAATLCTNQWETLIKCMSTKSTSDFECDPSDDEIDLKSGVCTTEKAAFDTCLGG